MGCSQAAADCGEDLVDVLNPLQAETVQNLLRLKTPLLMMNSTAQSAPEECPVNQAARQFQKSSVLTSRMEDIEVEALGAIEVEDGDDSDTDEDEDTISPIPTAGSDSASVLNRMQQLKSFNRVSKINARSFTRRDKDAL